MIAKGKKASILIAPVALAVILLAGCSSLPTYKASSSAASSSPASSSPVSSSQTAKVSENSEVDHASTVSSDSATSSAESDDWVYYTKRKWTSQENVYPLYRAHADGTGEKRISDIVPGGYVVSGGWIYYGDFYGKGIYKIHGDGSGKVKVSGINGSPAAIDSNYLYLYYQAKSDPKIGDFGNYLYRMRLDGTALQKMRSDAILGDMVLHDGYIYYSDNVEDAPLYRMRADGTGEQKLTSDKVGSSFDVYKNTIYYVDHGKNYLDGFGKICRINLDGSGKKDLEIDSSSTLKIDNDHLYFIRTNPNDNFCKADLDGKGIVKLNEKSWEVTKVFGFCY